MAQFSSSAEPLPETNVRQLIDTSLVRYADFGDGCPDHLADAIRHSLLAPGKRLRPRLVLLAAQVCGCSLERALPAACAVEMVHAYSLIHDDLPAMDDDDMRRGRPTCHVAFDEATAILAGDALVTRAFEVLATGVKPPAVAAACCAELAKAAGAAGMVGGQADDLAAEQTHGGIEQLESIHHRKTGAMLVVSLRIGALVAGADDDDTAHLISFGTKLGLAFQIIDDLLDFHGREDKVGKRTGKDSDRGKLTFPRLLGPGPSRARAARLVEEACHSLETLGTRAEPLKQLAHYVLERDQ